MEPFQPTVPSLGASVSQVQAKQWAMQIDTIAYLLSCPPEQLNDPLEGYREVYWSSERIFWINLFRHYLLVLAFRSWQYNKLKDYLYDAHGKFPDVADDRQYNALVVGCNDPGDMQLWEGYSCAPWNTLSLRSR